MADEIIVETTSTEVVEIGTPGPQGASGQGVPVGGTTGQVLRKASGTNYDTEWATGGAGGGVSSWNDLEDKPATFPPSSHSHPISEVTNLQTSLDGKAATSHSHSISDVTSLQTSLDGKAASSHSHGNITNGGLVGTTSGLPLKTGTGGIVEAGAFGTSAGQFAEGNDTRITNILASSVDTRNGNAVGGFAGGNGGYINLKGGDGDSILGAGSKGGYLKMTGSTTNNAPNGAGYIDTSAIGESEGGNIITRGGGLESSHGGSINTSGGATSFTTGGSINTHGGTNYGNGGSINTTGGSGELAHGGSINTYGGSEEAALGGSIDTYGGVNGAGGSINTSNGGGSINTRGTGSIELGVSGTRTTLTGTATAARAISLPNRSGTVVVSDTSAGSGSDVVNNIVSLTQAEYNAIGSPDAATLYLITDP